MDCIMQKLNSLIAVSDENSVEMQTLLKERIEYILYLVLGCLWNVNISYVELDKRSKLVEELHKMTIGQVVGAIRILDIKQQYISKSGHKIFDKYPTLRNETMGHGYIHSDNELLLEELLNSLYEELIKLEFLAKSYDLISIQNIVGNKYIGLRYSINSGGIPVKWACPIEVLGENVPLESVYLCDDKMNYQRVSPFVAICNKGEEIFVFQSLKDKLSGNVKMSQLFKSKTIEIRCDELISISNESDRRRVSSNGTIMNYFEKNYNSFITVPVERTIEKFLIENKSNVQATIWGHGGVGKTACIQNVCMNMYNRFERIFSYIIFTSAKERMYDPKTGKIVEVRNLRSYEEIIDNIIAVVFDEDNEENLEKKEKKVYSITSKTLLIIDDYETFSDDEKEKIQVFINSLNMEYFRVVLTTRNRRLSTGVEISSDEFVGEETKKFLISIFQHEYPHYIKEIQTQLSQREVMLNIQETTSGRAIFLYQFANIYAQKGFDVKFLSELKDSKNAQEFLYGKIYSYLSDVGRLAFDYIPKISEEKNYIFKERILKYVLNDYDEDEVISAVQELVDQKIIEQYDEENYRVYSKELYSLMQENYSKTSNSIKGKITNKLQDIGGINIRGSIYEAMLEEANNYRNQGNAQLVVDKYKRLLNEKKCDKNVKKKALLNLASYMNINLLDVEGAILLFDEYFAAGEFQNDIDVIKLYAQYLWSVDDTSKAKACDILERYFSSKVHKKTAIRNLELFSMAVTYCIYNVMENTPQKVQLSAKQRVFNDYGRVIYEYAISHKFSEHRPSIKHNISLALINTAQLALDLSNHGYKRSEYVNGIVDFGNENFIDLFKRQLKKIQYEIEKKQYSEGEVVDATISYMAQYGILVNIYNQDKAIIHNTEIPYGKKSTLKKGMTIKARILGQSEKGYMLSLKE